MIDPQNIIRAINRADTARNYLRETYLPGTPQNGPRAQNAAPPAPLDLAKLDQINLITDQLAEWAQLIKEETHHRIDTATETYLRRHATHAAKQPWALDMIEELNISAAKGAVMAGASTKRTPAGHCECGKRQWIYHTPHPHIRCRNGHQTTPTDHLPPTTTYTLTQAATLLGITQPAITKAIKTGKLQATPPGKGQKGTITAQALHNYQQTRKHLTTQPGNTKINLNR